MSVCCSFVIYFVRSLCMVVVRSFFLLPALIFVRSLFLSVSRYLFPLVLFRPLIIYFFSSLAISSFRSLFCSFVVLSFCSSLFRPFVR